MVLSYSCLHSLPLVSNRSRHNPASHNSKKHWRSVDQPAGSIQPHGVAYVNERDSTSQYPTFNIQS
jgi:hypothetical protein